MFKPFIDFDYEMEAAVLGVFLLEPDSYGRFQHMLIEDCFYKQEHLTIYHAISSLYKEGMSIDILLVCRVIYDKNITALGHSTVPYFLSQLTLGVVNSAHLESWCLVLRELAMKRALARITTSGFNSQDDVIKATMDIEAKLKGLLDIKRVDDWEDASKVALRLTDHMEAIAKGETRGITCGVRQIDEMNGRLKPGQFVIVAARPGVGKSAFMGRMAVAAAQEGHQVGVISLEMDNKDVFARMVAFNSDSAFWKIDRSEFRNAEEHRTALGNISKTAALPLYFSDTPAVSLLDIRSKAEKLRRKNGLKILFVDYLQLIEPEGSNNSNREREVAIISRGCKLLAKQLEIPVVLMAQLNRQAATDEPQLMHLRESGSLEQDADIVFMLHRDLDAQDEAIKRTASVFVRKWRNGSTARIDMHFDPEHMRFREYGEEEPGYVEYVPPGYDNPHAGIRPHLAPPSINNDIPF